MPRLPRRRVLALAAVAIAIVAGTYAHFAANARMAALAERTTAQQRAFEARLYTRRPFAGAVTDGDAFAHYDAATVLVQELGQPTAEALRELRLHPDQSTPAAAAALLQRYQPALQAMQDGAHCNRAEPHLDWSLGFSNHTQNLLVLRDLANAAVLQGRRLLDAGDRAAAVALLLDAATMGSDLARSPMLIDQMIGCALVAIVSSEAWDEGRLRQLDRASLQTLATGLQRLDAALPKALELTGEALLFANTVLRHDEGLTGLDVQLRSWGYLFSARWAIADAAMLEFDLAAELAAAAAISWPQRQLLFDNVTTRASTLRNPMLAIALPNLLGAEHSLRETLTRVRLLRCEVLWRLGERTVTLDDPLGDGPLAIEQADGGVHFVSAGMRRDQPIERVLGSQ